MQKWLRFERGLDWVDKDSRGKAKARESVGHMGTVVPPSTTLGSISRERD